MRRHALFLGVVVLIAAAWFAMLLRSQTHVHSDEAIIGLMGKHILEGRYFPFYMYGQPYNAGAAWEAYLTAVAFAFLGVSVISLKACIVVLSLLVLFLFYRMCLALYDQRTALLATIVFALTPSLLKWHFQVRGYSWYFISIPLLLVLFLWIQSTPNGKWPLFFWFGIVSGLNIWSLELGIAFTAGLWLLLLLRRGLSFTNLLVAAIGFIAGYTPAIVFNLTHQLTNWSAVLEKTSGGGPGVLFHPNALWQIFVVEMPKFFGVDTVLWYYPETSTSGVVFYAIALIATGIAAWPFIRSPSKIAAAVRGGFLGANEEHDLLLLVLTLVCLVPYATAPFRVPGYFLSGCFFLAALTGRIIARCFVSSKALTRISGAGILAVIVITGSALMVEIGRHNEIETLTLCEQGKNYCMTRIPGADLEGVERDLRHREVTGVWTTVSFVYPLLFECGETFAVSDSIFGNPHRVYPPAIPRREPNPQENFAIVLERDSPFRAPLEARFLQVTRATAEIREYGTLAVVEAKPR